jgi:hypothetical protein
MIGLSSQYQRPFVHGLSFFLTNYPNTFIHCTSLVCLK